MGTLDSPGEGEIVINNINTKNLRKNELSDFRNRQIGFIFQFHQLLPEFSCLENVCMPAYIMGKGKKEAVRNAGKWLEYLGLSHRITHKPSELSGGEQQRVAVARALVNNPSVVFADEPSGNLDSKNALDLHELFFNLKRDFNQTFIIVTHNMELANQADRKLQMKDGYLYQS
jgi:lipoprotein-releasing system ATP-binding protein